MGKITSRNAYSLARHAILPTLRIPKVKHDSHGARAAHPRARASRARGHDRKIPHRPARETDQYLSHAAQRATAGRELVQSFQYGAMEDDASRPAARDLDHPNG